MSLDTLVTSLQDDYQQSMAVGDTPVFSAIVTAYGEGEISTAGLSDFLGTAGGAAGVALCAAGGAAALAPICAKAGETAGQIVASIFGDGAKPGSSEGSDPHPWAELYAKRQAARDKVLTLAGDSETALKLNGIVNKFVDVEALEQETKPGFPGMAGLPLAGGYAFSWLSPHWILPLDFPLYEGFDAYGIKVIEGKIQSTYPPAHKPSGDWVTRLCKTVATYFRLSGVNVDYAADIVIADLEGKNPGWHQVLQALEDLVYPALDKAFEVQVKDVLISAEILRKRRVIETLEALTVELFEKYGMSMEIARLATEEIALAVQSGSSLAVEEAISRIKSDASKPRKAPEGMGLGAKLFLGVLTLSAAAAGGLAAWRVRAGKKPIPSSIRHPLR
jgi:hypothetical protein